MRRSRKGAISTHFFLGGAASAQEDLLPPLGALAEELPELADLGAPAAAPEVLLPPLGALAEESPPLKESSWIAEDWTTRRVATAKKTALIISFVLVVYYY